MKKILCLCLICMMLGCQNKTDNTIDTSYDIDITLDTKKNRLYEDVSITIVNNTNNDLNTLILRNMAKGACDFANKYNRNEGNKSKDSKITSITYHNQKIDYNVNKTVITCPLDSSIKSHSQDNISIRMWTDIPIKRDRFGVEETKYGKLYNLSFCFPTLADFDKDWIINPYFDDGESRSESLKDYTVTIHKPDDYIIASAGTIKDNTITIQQARDIGITICNFMDVDHYQVSGVNIDSYYLKAGAYNKYRSISQSIVEDSIHIYKNYFEEYPSQHLVLSEGLFGYGFGGMEYSDFVMINGQNYFNNNLDYASVGLSENIAHEIGHQYFYHAVGNNEYQEAWLDEGITTYLERQLYSLTPSKSTKYIQKDSHLTSINQRKKEIQSLVKEARKDKEPNYINISPDQYINNQMYGDKEYDVAYMFLLELEDIMGDNNFHTFLKDYYFKYKNHIVSTNDFKSLLLSYNDSKAIKDTLDKYLK